MPDCPYCDGYRYDPTAPAVVIKRLANKWPPVVWDGAHMRQARGSEAPNGRPLSLARHICEQHPMESEVLLLGPVVIEPI